MIHYNGMFNYSQRQQRQLHFDNLFEFFSYITTVSRDELLKQLENMQCELTYWPIYKKPSTLEIPLLKYLQALDSKIASRDTDIQAWLCTIGCKYPYITKTVELGDLAPLWSIEIVYRQKPSVLVGGVIHTSLGFRIFENEQTKAITCEILDQYAGHIVIGFNNLELAKKAQKFLEEGIK